MFRQMRRIKQQLSEEECLFVLTQETRGVLCVLSDGGYPYGIPINFYYSAADKKIYFHGAREGHKIDSIKNSDKVSFTVFEKGVPTEGKKGLNVRSVIVFGRIKIVEDRKKTFDICRNIAGRFDFANKEYIENEIQKFAKAVTCLELTLEYMTGKLINES